MVNELRFHARVREGNRIELSTPELNVGEEVDIVVRTSRPDRRAFSVASLISTGPPGPRSASNWNEVEAELQSGRDSWDR